MQFRYKNAYGLRLHICTNEPEVCGFMTNEYKAGKLAVMKCDQCRDGYLIAKPAKDGDYFLGCSNYNKNGTGCSRSMSKKQYYELLNLGPDPIPVAPTPAKPMSPHTKPSVREASKPIVYDVIPKAKTKAFSFEEADLNDVAHTVIQCLSNISAKRYYGVNILIDVLRGASSKRIQEAQLDDIPEYGALKHVRRETLTYIVEWLIEQNFILKTKGMYPVLHPTYNGQHYAETMTNAKLKNLSEYLASPPAKSGSE
jgi:DNA helicase-4